MLIILSVLTTHWDRCCDHLHFVGEEIKAYKGLFRSTNYQEAEPGFELLSLHSYSNLTRNMSVVEN